MAISLGIYILFSDKPNMAIWGVMPLCHAMPCYAAILFSNTHPKWSQMWAQSNQLARLKCRRTWDATLKKPKNHQRNCIQHPFGTLNMILVLDIFRESSKMYELAGTCGSNMSYQRNSVLSVSVSSALKCEREISLVWIKHDIIQKVPVLYMNMTINRQVTPI